MSPWKASKDGKQGHHILPKHEQRKALGQVYDETKIRVIPEGHEQMHRDEREVGPIGSIVRHDKRRMRGSKIIKLP